MAWWVQVLEIANGAGNGTGKFRMVATSDEGGGIWGNTDCYHATREEADQCEACDDYMARITGFPSRKQEAAEKEAHDLREYERLKSKFEGA